ncbi:MAG: FeoA family protein, partial [Candidatus Omnitrophica bacterium]|nr:FeoA family protein [Candidatus Omnitrophota bacterium]
GGAVLKKKLLDMGIVPGSGIEVLRVAPLGDPVEVRIKGYNLSLRKEEASQISIEVI